MSPTTKVMIGALATAALAGLLHGPMGLGARCAAAAGLASARPPPGVELSADTEAVASCQKRIDQAIIGKTIRFGSGGAQIAPVSKDLLDAIAASLTNCAGTMVEVAGYTDRVGDAERNRSLSQARAEAVRAALIERGAPRERLVAAGYGESTPTDPDAPETNSADRRIEFSVSTRPVPAAPAAN